MKAEVAWLTAQIIGAAFIFGGMLGDYIKFRFCQKRRESADPVIGEPTTVRPRRFGGQPSA